MNVRMPDGTVIKNVPDNITQDDLLSRYQGFSQSLSDPAHIGGPPGQDTGVYPGPPPAEQLSLTEKLFARGGRRPGQPVEVIPGAESLQWMEQNPDIVGSTVASIFAPQVAVPAAIAKYGPAASQLFSQFASKVPAAFMGGAAGQQVGRQTGGVKTDPNAELSDILLDNIKAGGRMAEAEALGGLASPLLAKAFAPGRSSLTPEASILQGFAREKNVPMSPDMLSPNVTAKVLKGGTDNFLPSRLVNDAYRKKTIQRFNELSSEISGEVGPLEGNNIITPKAIDELKVLYEKKAMAGKKLANDFLEAVGHNTEIPVDATSAILKSINKSAVDPALREFASTKLQQLKGPVTASELETALRQIGGIKPKTDTKFLEQLRTAIKSDFEKAGAPVDMLSEANQAFKENIGLLAGQGARQLKAMLAKGEEPAFLTAKIFRTGNEGLIKSLASEAEKGTLKKDVWDSLRAQNLKNMFDHSSVESKRLMGLKVLDGTKLEKMIESNRGALELAYKDKPGALEGLRNLARLAKASKPDLAEFEQGMDRTLKGTQILGLPSAAMFEPTSIVIGSTTAPAIAWQMMSPKGKMFKWLTTGYDSTAAEQGLKLGGRAVFQESGE